MSTVCAPAPQPASAQGLALGLDVGGTHTRWALWRPGADALLAEGQAPGWSGLMAQQADGRATIAQALAPVAAACAGHGPLQTVQAGITGFDAAQTPVLAPLLGQALSLPVAALRLMNDIEAACLAAFAPGQGFVLLAGTGSVAAFVDGQGVLQRAGGRGAVIDDAGSGHWIASQALRAVWRAEDERPGAWRQSPLAQRLFDQMGGADWACTRQWVYGASRGELGTLALAVADAARQGDAVAGHILDEAGRELARLPLALARRHGPHPLVLSGRVFDLHLRVLTALRQTLQTAADTAAAADPARAAAWATLALAQPRALQPHHAAARLAAGRLLSPAKPV